MRQECIEYIDKVACIAHANMAHHQIKPMSQRSDSEAGAALLMSAFLEMHDHWRNVKPGIEPPSDRVYVAAKTCEHMRRELQLQDRAGWSEEAEGLFQLMTAFMFLFKHMYVPHY